MVAVVKPHFTAKYAFVLQDVLNIPPFASPGLGLLTNLLLGTAGIQRHNQLHPLHDIGSVVAVILLPVDKLESAARLKQH